MNGDDDEGDFEVESDDEGSVDLGKPAFCFRDICLFFFLFGWSEFSPLVGDPEGAPTRVGPRPRLFYSFALTHPRSDIDTLTWEL